jgi:hypothetical protein
MVMSGSVIRIDDHGVHRQLANGKVEEVAWDALEAVCVLTTTDGPFAEDVYFVLAGRDGSGCVVPHGAPESGHLLEWLQRLPGFDNKALIRAMCSTGDARFLCWRRAVQAEGGEAGGPAR